MGLAPLVVSNLYELVAQVAREGVAVLVVEQFASAVLGISDHAAVMVNGRIALAGPPSDGFVEQLSALYLGGSAPETPRPVKPIKAPVAPTPPPPGSPNAVRPIKAAPGPPRRPPGGNGAAPGEPARPVSPTLPTRAPADERFGP
jgi:hypothetical protein